jgi:hypothetical protein
MTPEEKIDWYIFLCARIIAVAGCIIALVILIDYLLPGYVVEEPVEGRTAEQSSSHRNRHFAYRVDTPERSFYCKRDFFVQVTPTDSVRLHLSPWFSAVNSYACNRFMPEAETFSLRYVSAVLLPLLMWLLTLFAWKRKHQVLYFIIFILSLLNLITLIMLLQ